MRGMIIAGTHSGCGKTTAALGIMAALRKRGLNVQPFKAGPDFIDTGLHRLAAGRRSRNLDQWMCGRDYVIDCFQKHALASDIAVIEGVMGMYDGEFSTASLARLLQVPVILVIDSYGMAESAGAMVKGFAEFGGDLKLAGVIFNRVASDNHYKRLKDSVRDAPVLGCLPRELNFEIPHRHLGLATAEENPISCQNIDRLADTVLRYIDVDAIIRKAKLAKDKDYHREAAKDAKETMKFKLAVAYDKAFSFYYEDNLDLLRNAGAEIIRFSPLVDAGIPAAADAVYIGGGYPELNVEELSRNTSMLASIREWTDSGKLVYAECGGLMYLSHGILDFDNNFFPMAGVFPFETRMMRKPRLAYREVVLNEDCILGNKGETCRGHEFHYSEIAGDEMRNAECRALHPASTQVPGVRNEKIHAPALYSVRDKNGATIQLEGFRIKNTLASYIHIHFGSNPDIAGRFADFVLKQF